MLYYYYYFATLGYCSRSDSSNPHTPRIYPCACMKLQILMGRVTFVNFIRRNQIDTCQFQMAGILNATCHRDKHTINFKKFQHYKFSKSSTKKRWNSVNIVPFMIRVFQVQSTLAINFHTR